MMVNERNSRTTSIRRIGGWQAWTRVIGIVAVLVASLGGPMVQRSSVTRAAGATVVVVDSATTVRSSLNLTGYLPQANLIAAKNEFESFQVVIRATEGALNGVSVGMDPNAPLTSGANTIPSPKVTFYREVDYNVQYESDGEGAKGAWPDALIPEVDPYYQLDRNAFPYNVPSGGQVVVWVDIQVPQNQVAGHYQGNVVVQASTGVIQSIPIALTVANFAIPSTSSLRSLFPTFYTHPCNAHRSSGNCGGNVDLNWKLHALYARAGLDNRVTISNPGAIDPSDNPPTAGSQQLTYFNTYILPLLQGTSDKVRLPQAKLTTYHKPSWYCDATCMAHWGSFAQANGFYGALVDYTCDEPTDSYSVTGALVHQRWSPHANQGSMQSCSERLNRATTIPKLVTKHVQEVPATLLPKVDILVPVGNRMHDKQANTCCAGDQRAAYNAYLDVAGTPANQLWLYESNMSFGANGPDTCGAGCWDDPYWNGWPGYAIDAPAIQARAMSWLAFQYDVTGELYWHTTERLTSAWANSYEQGGNGDGTLFYPGIPSGRGVPGDVNYAPAIGGTQDSDIPIESIRLKRIRDGREDYEYLKILSDTGRRAEALPIVESVFGLRSSNNPGPMFSITANSTTVTSRNLDNARRALITKITGASPSQVDVAVTMTDAPDPVATDGTLTYTIVVSNNSTATATGVTLTDTLPNGVLNNTMGSWPGGTCTRSGQVVTCAIGTIAAGSSVTVTLPITAPAVVPASGTITNTATASGNETDSNTANNTATVTTTIHKPTHDLLYTFVPFVVLP